MDFVAQRDLDLSKKRLLTDCNCEDVAASASDSANQSQDQNTRSSQEMPRPWPSRRDFESAIQRQMEMMSQRMMALEARQHRHEDAAAELEPPDYESHAWN
ncbi:hypothetical protein C0992_008702 [Termitomyces sp. T32_za158]|nr:hypothetical protein C0992_008702 [Termitomyces sp. T32_za158]